MIAIHRREGSFSDVWIQYCEQNNIQYKIVNAYDEDIVNQLKSVDGFMWHWVQQNYQDQLFSRQLTFALESIGVTVFPDSKTSWHYDDKIGQKYLLEAYGIDIVRTYCFYDYFTTIKWLNKASFPLVFKLRGGAGSRNVRLLKGINKAKRFAKRAFNKGFPSISRESILKESIWRFKRDHSLANMARIVKCVITLPRHKELKSLLPLQKGYFYVQEFVEDNHYDDRLIVIGDRCFCIRRQCRVNDFRASGSGLIVYDIDVFPLATVQLAFSVSKLLNTKCIALDFVYTKKGEPKLIEISYSFSSKAYYDCQGYYDQDLKWVNEKVQPERFIIEDFISELSINK